MSNRPYSVYAAGVTNTAAKTMINLVSTAAIQPRLYDIVMSSPATPADNAGQYQLKRFTNPGTSTGVTPQTLGANDPGATATAGSTNTVEPTYTAGAIMLGFSLNQRATFRWVAVPGSEIVLPSTASNGVGMFTNAVNSAFTVDNTFLYYE